MFTRYYSGDIYVARVIGAMCNCLPAEGETQNVSCQDYRVPESPGPTVITAELTNRGRCYAENGFYTGNLRVCSNLDTDIIPQGIIIVCVSSTCTLKSCICIQAISVANKFE